MSGALSHRGPDDEGSWSDGEGRVAFAHRRLSIIDLSPLGHQPMHSADGSHTIVFNGEIYNYQALRDELVASGHSFRSHSDTEVLLALYARDGEDMCGRLRGMYAFSIYDHKKQSLFLARDPYGIKPLYYAVRDGLFTFASTYKAVVASGQCDRSLDPAGAVSFFVFGYVASPHTLCKGVKQVPAGHTMRVDANGASEPRPFYSLRKTLLDAAHSPARQEDMREALVEAVRDSVRHHLVADVPVGLFLSAGVDSTSLLSEITRSGYPVSTLTLGFNEYRGTALDEVPLAESAATTVGAQHHTVWITGKEFSSDMDDILAKMDMPSIDGVNTYLVSKHARECGFKVAVSGLGGDEILGGYSSFADVPKIQRMTRWAAAAPWLGRMVRRAVGPLLGKLTSPKFAGLLEYGGSMGGAYLLRRGHFLPHELKEFLDPDLVAEGWDTLRATQQMEALVEGVEAAHARVALLEAQWYMQNQLLRDSDWASMAHGVELRVPLVDVKLFEALAPYIAHGCPPSKGDLAACLHPDVKDKILNRPKSGFAVPVREWLMHEDATNSERSVRSFAKLVARSFGIPTDGASKSRAPVGPAAKTAVR